MEIKDQATAVEAALNLDRPGSEPTAPKPGEPPAPKPVSTAAKLFPDFVSEDGLIVNRPVKDFEDKGRVATPAAATPAPAAAPATTTPPAPTAPGELDLSKLPDGTMVRIKVDGVEMTVPAKEALKNIQLERHITQKSQELARERAAFEAERAASRNTPPVQPKAGEVTPPPSSKPSPEAERIANLERTIADLQAAVAPQRFQTGLNRLAERAKQEFGATDFLEYAPKIQAFVDSELAKPEVAANPQLLQQLDSQSFWYGKYQELKLKDVLSGANPAAPAIVPTVATSVPTTPAPPGTTLVLDKNNKPVIVPIVEGSSGVPSRTSPDADWQARYAAAFETASKTGRTEDWQKVFALKREIPAN